MIRNSTFVGVLAIMIFLPIFRIDQIALPTAAGGT
jgi:hypothetical protein